MARTPGLFSRVWNVERILSHHLIEANHEHKQTVAHRQVNSSCSYVEPENHGLLPLLGLNVVE